MSPEFDSTLYETQAVLVTILIVGTGLWLLLRRLSRSRPELAIGRAMATGFGVRLAAAVAVGLFAPDMRGIDEELFLADAEELSELPIGSSGWFDNFISSFQIRPDIGVVSRYLPTWLFATEMRVANLPELGMRVIQIGIAVAGLVFLAAAVYDIAGPRAARIAGWVLALEPANVFFSGFLHKEPLLLLGVGVTVFGGAAIWKRRDAVGLTAMTVGGLIAIGTRPYAGWLLVTAAGAICMHGALTRRGRLRRRSLKVALVVLLLLVAAAPQALKQTSDDSLQQSLVPSQQLNTSDSSNLRLEEVDFSTRMGVITNLPVRMRDVLLRPYPWQLSNSNQRLGLLGTLFALTALILLARAMAANRGQVFERSGPFIYPAMFLLAAFAIASGNAGTSFRLRTHLVALAVCLIIVLREAAREPVVEEEDDATLADGSPSEPGRRLPVAAPPQSGLLRPPYAKV